MTDPAITAMAANDNEAAGLKPALNLLSGRRDQSSTGSLPNNRKRLSGAVMADAFSGLTGFITGFLGTLGAFATAWPAALDQRLGMLAPIVAGAATALAVAIAMAVYFRSGYRTSRDVVRHGVATIVVVALVAFAISDIRHAALSYLGINPAKPAVEFEIRLPSATVFAAIPAEAQV